MKVIHTRTHTRTRTHTHRHAGVPPRCVTSSAGILNPLLHLPTYKKPKRKAGKGVGPDGEEPAGEDRLLCTGEEVGHRVLEVFTELSKELRQLSDLPLSITSLQGISPTFRHTEVHTV